MFKSFLSELAKVLQFPSLAPDKNGACLIIMKDKNIPLLFELDEQIVPNKVVISSRLMPFPMERRMEIYEESLKLNDTLEETVSVKPDEDVLVLHTRISPEMKTQELEVMIHGFMEQVQKIKSHIEEFLHKPSKQIPPSSFEAFPYKA